MADLDHRRAAILLIREMAGVPPDVIEALIAAGLVALGDRKVQAEISALTELLGDYELAVRLQALSKMRNPNYLIQLRHGQKKHLVFSVVASGSLGHDPPGMAFVRTACGSGAAPWRLSPADLLAKISPGDRSGPYVCGHCAYTPGAREERMEGRT